ncbi:cobalamin-binding protein [Janibacter melonis]|uniref:cobalamin-binding protein n=1 Tax=Janibacter melonis TaxID=262209 RepID=UPI0017494747|nr:cobalamin-binding protein [Janibacter melonis]
MRVVSLLPSTTEILFALGAGDDVVGVTFECDHPAQARERRVVSTSTMPEGLSPREIDDFVKASLERGDDLYHLQADALAELDPDLVVTQDLCAVCAIDVTAVDEAMAYLGCRADVLTFDPHTIDEVLASVISVGDAVGRRAEADALVRSLRERLAAVADAVAGTERPRVLVLEWTDPPFAPGHWIPEMVIAAGGEPVLGVAGERSEQTTWDAAVAAAPDVVICAPCGYDLDGAAEQAAVVAEHFPGVPVWAVDANGSYARPGPRVVDGVEALAGILHPERVGQPDSVATRQMSGLMRRPPGSQRLGP